MCSRTDMIMKKYMIYNMKSKKVFKRFSTNNITSQLKEKGDTRRRLECGLCSYSSYKFKTTKRYSCCNCSFGLTCVKINSYLIKTKYIPINVN